MYVYFVELDSQPVGRQGCLQPVLVGSVEDMAQVAVMPLCVCSASCKHTYAQTFCERSI